MEDRFHSVTITVYDREAAFNQVSTLLHTHTYAKHIQARLGYPLPGKNVAVIFLILKMTNNELGTLSGKLGQLPQVSVKAITLYPLCSRALQKVVSFSVPETCLYL